MGWRYGFFRLDEPIMHCHNHFPLIISLSNNTSSDACQLEAVSHTPLTVLQSGTHGGRSRACVTGVRSSDYMFLNNKYFVRSALKKRAVIFIFSSVPNCFWINGKKFSPTRKYFQKGTEITGSKPGKTRQLKPRYDYLSSKVFVFLIIQRWRKLTNGKTLGSRLCAHQFSSELKQPV